MGGAFEGLSVTAMMTKECEQVLGKKAQGVEAPSARSILKGLVSGWVRCDVILDRDNKLDSKSTLTEDIVNKGQPPKKAF